MFDALSGKLQKVFILREDGAALADGKTELLLVGNAQNSASGVAVTSTPWRRSASAMP